MPDGGIESHLIEIDEIYMIVARSFRQVAKVSDRVGFLLGIRPILEIEVTQELDGLIYWKFQPAVSSVKGCIGPYRPIVLMLRKEACNETVVGFDGRLARVCL